MSRRAVGCALLAGLLAGIAVAWQPVGLALTVVLVLITCAAAPATGGSRSWPLLLLAGLLALQPMLRDAGWVVALCVGAALVASAAAVVRTPDWRGLGHTVLAPFALWRGVGVIATASRVVRPDGSWSRSAPLLRGLALGLMLTVSFGALLVSADSAFAELVDDAITVDLTPDGLIWRGILAAAVTSCAGALASWPGRSSAASTRTPWAPGRTEASMALGALVLLFGVFVAVQIRVLFGGAGYVQSTTGLGYGEYAREGFVQLLLAAAGTLGVIAVAARRDDRVVRGLLGALCLLTLVMLASAHHRLDLVEEAYGFTRVRYGGHAVVIWLAAIFVIVLAAGTRRRFAEIAPRVALVTTLAGVLAFSLSNPDARIARLAVDRFAERGTIDTYYLSKLSADALSELERLPQPERDRALLEIRASLAVPDGLAGLNIARARARDRLP